MAISKQTTAIIVIIIVFIVINGIIIAFWLIELNKYNTCKVTQSLFCPTISCNAGNAAGFKVADSDPQNAGNVLAPTTIGTGSQCYPYAYRVDENGNTVCNYPGTRGNLSGAS